MEKVVIWSTKIWHEASPYTCLPTEKTLRWPCHLGVSLINFSTLEHTMAFLKCPLWNMRGSSGCKWQEKAWNRHHYNFYRCRFIDPLAFVIINTTYIINLFIYLLVLRIFYWIRYCPDTASLTHWLKNVFLSVPEAWIVKGTGKITILLMIS